MPLISPSMTRIGTIIVLSLILNSQFIYGTVVNISAPDYKNQTIIWKKKIDYISNQYQIIDQQTINGDGFAKLNFDAQQIELTELHIGRSHAMLYLDTATTHYNLYFPKDTLIEEASFKKSKVQLLFINIESTDINNLILDFNLQVDFFLYGDTSKIIRMAKHNREFQDSLNNFKFLLAKRYDRFPIKFLHNYIRYEIALLEQLAHQSKGEYYKSYLYDNYLKNNEINYKNDAYMQFFNIFYSDVFSIGNVGFNEKIKFAVNNFGSFHKLLEVIKGSRFFINPKLAELAIIKGLYDGFNSIDYNTETILSFLIEIRDNSKWEQHRIIASNCILELTKLSKGAAFPNFKFIDTNQLEISIKNLKGKYTYLNFFATWNNNSLHEMEVINQFSKKYSFINFLSVNLDGQVSDLKEFLANNDFNSWPICFPLNKEDIISYLNLDHLPTHLLIDPKGFIYQYPSLPPISLYNDQSIDKLFFDIQKKLEPKKKYNIGSRN